MALVDENGRIMDSVYMKNRGIAETIQEGFREIRNEPHEIVGVGCTGSGRRFAGLLVGADLVKTEILAHTIATLHLFPKVHTIMDIGGEDCKIMEVKECVLTNFIMNNVCGAGTGAVVEAIASRLGVPIEEVGDLALSSQHQLDFPGKCGIFCQSAVVSKLNSGAAKSDILMGVVRALVSNYLSLSRGLQLRPPYVFQGATARNKAIVKALEMELQDEVVVPEECAIMGALGIALMTMEAEVKQTKFRGFENHDLNHESVNFRCFDCPNRCEVTQLYEEGQLLGCVGSWCEKWNDLEYRPDSLLQLVPA
jgi:predicted CoA-substrate-specific enzyme activase